MSERFFILGSFFALLAVAAGAFGGHLLKPRLAPDLYDIFEVAVRYHMYHALALLATAWAITQWPGTLTQIAGWAFVAGIVIFAGSLYILSLSGVRWLGAITPLGGLCFMAGWFCLAWAAWRP
ncbi:MAG: DUF423 domain-containing protein [Candidatus Latescibacterota bacterium]|jgi:uncharacterized membrane protein YgdD (TMEM256/DUF423 family)